jgi:hypothetical protein
LTASTGGGFEPDSLTVDLFSMVVLPSGVETSVLVLVVLVSSRPARVKTENQERTRAETRKRFIFAFLRLVRMA